MLSETLAWHTADFLNFQTHISIFKYREQAKFPLLDTYGRLCCVLSWPVPQFVKGARAAPSRCATKAPPFSVHPQENLAFYIELPCRALL
ncbi:jg986 [Pararge aegeria aegeria]|uniref:Jg986 protein n=1 Tax=Pararge aegeria aegeria TaxID=348720 RepID=A0A8S4QX07_9NEOP|nr:jg986 [Pararge aegeria aegeria]